MYTLGYNVQQQLGYIGAILVQDRILGFYDFFLS